MRTPRSTAIVLEQPDSNWEKDRSPATGTNWKIIRRTLWDRKLRWERVLSLLERTRFITLCRSVRSGVSQFRNQEPMASD